MNYNDKYQSHYQGKDHKEWRRQVMMRDMYLCQHCKAKGIVRAAKQAHHILPIETHWDLRYDVDNGVALCKNCHNFEHSRVSPMQKFMEEWNNG